MLEEADTSAKKMVCHNEADGKVVSLKVYYNYVSNMLYLAGFLKNLSVDSIPTYFIETITGAMGCGSRDS